MWQRKRLDAIATLSLGKMLDKAKNKGEPLPYLANINVQWGEIDLSNLREMRFKAEEIDRYSLRSGDIVMCEGGEPGRCALWTNQAANMMIQKALHRIRPTAEIDNRFLFYSLTHQAKSGYMDAYFTGATIKHLPREQLAKIEIAFPQLPHQRRIAAVLGAYDDLIEVNRRRIALLEEMARSLFEEWFIRFRFPGHEIVTVNEAPGGPLPEGWQHVSLSKLLTETRDAAMPSEVAAGTRYVGLEHLPRRSITLNDCGSAADASSLKLRFQRGDILFGKIRPYFHKVVWAPWSGIASSDALILRPAEKRTAMIALCLVSSDPFVAHSVQTSNGTKMPRANWGVLKRQLVPVPPDQLLECFNSVVEPGVKLAANLQAQNEQLAACRDLLLPRLISGQLTLPSAEPQLEGATTPELLPAE